MRDFKIVAMAHVKLIPKTIEWLFKYLALLYQYHWFFATLFWFLLSVCVAGFLFNINPPHIWRCQQIGKKIFFQTILSCLEPFCPKGMVVNSRTIRSKVPYSLVQWNVVTAIYTTPYCHIDVLWHFNDVVCPLGKRYFLK